MILYVTKKVAEKLKQSIKPYEDADAFYSWRANITKDGHHRMLVFVNDASRYVLVVKKPMAKDWKRLPELFKETLREALLMEQINPEVIELYLADLGDISYVANKGRKETAWLNTACNNAWYAYGRNNTNAELSVVASHLNVGDYADGDRDEPSRMLKELLKRYNLPVIKCKAFDMNVKLDLDGKDAIRRLRVPAHITFLQLHKLMQAAFDWKNYHLFSFGMFEQWNENPYSHPDVELVLESKFYDAYESNPNANSVAEVKLMDYIPEYNKILYTYDYGDDWRHYIEIENTINGCKEELPLLLSGEGDSPPEDVGGSGGYAEFLEVIANPEHEDYDHYTTWSNSMRWKSFDFEKTARRVKYALWW